MMMRRLLRTNTRTWRTFASHCTTTTDDKKKTHPTSSFFPPALSAAALFPTISAATTTTTLPTTASTVSLSSVLATSAATTVSPAATAFLQIFPPLAAQVVFLAPISAMKQFAKDRTTGDVSPIPYTAMCVNGIVWMAYGLLQGEPTIWVPNITAFAFGSVYVWKFSQFAAPSVNMNIQYGAIGVAAAATAGLCVGVPEQAGFIIGHVAIGIVAIMFGGPLASIKTVIKDKSTKSLPFAFTVAAFVNCISWSAYGYLVLDDYIVYLPNLLGLASSIVQLGLFAKFGIHKEEIKVGPKTSLNQRFFKKNQKDKEESEAMKQVQDKKKE